MGEQQIEACLADKALEDAILSARLEGQQKFGIEHATIQLETGDPAHPCPLAPAHVV